MSFSLQGSSVQSFGFLRVDLLSLSALFLSQNQNPSYSSPLKFLSLLSFCPFTNTSSVLTQLGLSKKGKEFIECLLYAFHHLAHKYSSVLHKIPKPNRRRRRVGFQLVKLWVLQRQSATIKLELLL